MSKLNQELLTAAKKGEIDNIKTALHLGADVDAVDTWGYSSLIIATEHGHTECIDLLIASGSNVNYIAKNKVIGQTTALKHSCYLGHPEIVKQLVDHGGNIHYIDDNYSNLLLWACGSRSENRNMIVNYLIDLGININHQNKMGTTALMMLNYPGPFDADLFSALIDKGADPSLKNIMGHDVEFLAQKIGRKNVVDLLSAYAN